MTHPIAKVSEEMNRKSVPGTQRYSFQFQPPAPTLRATIHIVTERQMDSQTDRWQYRANSRSYCATVG